MNHAGVGSTQVEAMNLSAALSAINWARQGTKGFLGPRTGGRGFGRSIAAALILMSDWCGLEPTQLIENPDAICL